MRRFTQADLDRYLGQGAGYRKFLSEHDECGECGNAACRGVELFPMRISGKTVARCWDCLNLTEVESRASRKLGLEWAEHQRGGGKHTEWHDACGCAYHPKPFPHVHPCSDKHKRPDLHISTATQKVVDAANEWRNAWGIVWEGDTSDAGLNAVNEKSKALYDSLCDLELAEMKHTRQTQH